MRGRLVLAVGLLAVLAGLAGCTSLLGPGQPDPAQLAENQTYDWDTNATTTFNVSRSSYSAVIAVENRSYVVVYQTDELGTDQPIQLRGLKFRYPNGTVVGTNETGNATRLTATNQGQRTNITLPQAGGTVAFTASRPNAKRFATPLFLEGAHSVEVVLPPRARVGVPLLSQVSPNADSRPVVNGRMRVHWNEVERGPVVVRYYLQRDLLLFGALGGGLGLVGVVGALYYYRQIRTLEKRREDIGLDVETEDDDIDDDGPPPGMR